MTKNNPTNNEDDPAPKKLVVCIFLEGLGIGAENEANAVAVAKMPNLLSYVRNYPVTLLSGADKDKNRRYWSLGTGMPDESDIFPQADTCLSEVLSKNSFKQLKICASEQIIGWNLFFNNNKEKPYAHEDRICLSTPSSIKDLDDLLKKTVKEFKKNYKDYDFVLMSIPLAHEAALAGNFKAAFKSLEKIDKILPKIIEPILADDSLLVISSPYGNAEKTHNLVSDWEDREPTKNPVPFLLIGSQYEGRAIGLADPVDGNLSMLAPGGSLADFAPTILSLLQIDAPESMKGESLI